VNFTSCNLANRDFENADLSTCILACANLSNSNLKNTKLPLNLASVNLTGCDLTTMDLSGHDLTYTQFINGKVPSKLPRSMLNTNFTNVDLTGFNLENTDLTGCIFVDAKLVDTNLKNAIVKGVDFTGSKLTRASLPQDLSMLNFAFAELTEINLSHCNFTQSNLANAKVTGSTLPVNLSCINLSNIDFSTVLNKDFTITDFSLSDLTNSNLNSLSISFSTNFMNSVLLNTKGTYGTVISPVDQLHLCAWTGGIKEWKLIYKGSVHGFASAEFHKRCDTQAHTITVILSANGFVFGGYTDLDWAPASTAGGFKSSTESFLFTLRNPFGIQPTKYILKSPQYAIYCEDQFGPTFGNGFDMNVFSDSNLSSRSYFNFPYTYEDSTGRGFSTFTGSSNFQTEEIEVFAVVQ